MLLGDRLPGAYTDWRVVEDDLYHVADRVREYDSLARLVRNDESGQLGLARWQENHPTIRGGALTLARPMHDLTTDEPLVSPPDGRVLGVMRATDSRRLRRMGDWYKRTAAAHHKRDERIERQAIEEHMPHAERTVHAMRHDLGVKTRAFIPDRAA